MSYFYIKIKEKENILFLKNTIELIKKYCLKNSNKVSLLLNKKEHSNCTLDILKDSYIKVYDTEDNKYEEYKKEYKIKYLVNEDDLEILFKVYNTINIEIIEDLKVQVKITYNLDFINALQFIIDILGKNEPINNIFYEQFGEIFNQIIINEIGYECAIIENNYIYKAIYENGSYKRKNTVEKTEIFVKYEQYKKLNKKFMLKGKQEIQKI